MTRCDHGIRLDRFCGDCEAGFAFRDPAPDARDRSRTVAVLCFLAAVALVLAAVIAQKEMS